MRAAAILGPGNLSKYVEKFQHVGSTEWTSGLPASSNDADVVLIFGGDGTVHRYLAQLVSLGIPVLVVPCGSGNDFARALKLRSVRVSLAAWRDFLEGGNNVRTIDLGVIQGNLAKPEVGGPQAQHYFCCVAG